MNSGAYQCSPTCINELVQTSQDSSQSARSAASSVAGVVTAIDEMRDMVDDIKDTSDNVEIYVYQLHNRIQELTDDITSLKQSINESMVPTVDDNVSMIVISTLGAFTICLVMCQILIFYTGRLEAKKEERRRIMVQQRREVI